eukprot:967381-Pyramimonas_sp.AAC.1
MVNERDMFHSKTGILKDLANDSSWKVPKERTLKSHEGNFVLIVLLTLSAKASQASVRVVWPGATAGQS